MSIFKEHQMNFLYYYSGFFTAQHSGNWEVTREQPGQARKNWVNVVKRDLRQMDLTWEEAEELANDKAEWPRRVAQCSHLDVAWTKV